MTYLLAIHKMAYRTVLFKAVTEGAVTAAPVPHIYVSKRWWRECGSPTKLTISFERGDDYIPALLSEKVKLVHRDTVGKTRREVATLDLPMAQLFVRKDVISAAHNWNITLESGH